MFRRSVLASFVVVATAVAGCQKGTDAPAAKSKEADPAVDLPERATKPTAERPPTPPAPPKATAKQVPAPFDVKTPPGDAEKTASGMIFKSITEGTGATPGPNDQVKVRYSAWREDGTTFATTEPATEPTAMFLFSSAPGFTEALQKMKVGGKAMFWLPPNIGYPGTPRGNPETLAYAVELVDVVWSPATPPDVAKAPADATRTKSGLRWKKVKSASGDKPRAWDVVHLAYTGWDATGKIIDSSEVYGKPVTAPLDRLPPVFGEVLPQLAAGERARMWFPAETLGPRRPGMPEGDLCFEVSLTEITRRAEPPKAPATVAKPPADAKKTPKGVSYQVLATDPSLPGAGTKPAATDRVTVNYSGWTTDGKLFDSSIPDGTPRTFSVNGVIAGWTDALLMMSVGDTWRVWIPEELAYKGAPNKPQGMLVFDVQLLGINQPPPTPAHGAP